MNDDIDTLLDELSGFEFSAKSNNISSDNVSILDEKDANQYFLNTSKALIEAGISAVQDLTPSVVQGQSPKEIEALSKLMAATAQALDTLNKGALIDKKANRDEQLEHIKIKAKKELVSLQPGTQKTTNNIVIASREEILKKLEAVEIAPETKQLA